MRGALRAAVVVGVLALPTGARAATVATYPGDADPDVGYEAGATITDTRGERNDLFVRLHDGRLRVRERGHPRLRAGRGCRNRGRRYVTCKVDPLGDVDLDAGAGEDRVVCRGEPVSLYGGRGADRLRAGGCGSDLYGGPGDDTLIGDRHPQNAIGGAGDDTIQAGGGNDLIYGDGVRRGHGSDMLDGGRGVDTASWDERRRGVRVDLRRGTGPEGDRLRSVEDAAGGDGNDVLLGDAGPNYLEGTYGRDLLDGRGGADRLDAGTRSPRYADGDEGVADRLRCGTGRDAVRFPGPSVLPASCELMRDWQQLDFVTVPVRPRPAGRRRFQVPAVCNPEYTECRRRAVISAHGVELGRSRLVSARSNVVWLTVTLERPVPARGPLRIDISGEDATPGDPDFAGPYSYDFTWRIGCRGAPRHDVCFPASS